MTRLGIIAVLAPIFVLPSLAQSTTNDVYCWRDAKGGLHYSNRATRVPKHATLVELPRLGSISGPRSARRTEAGRTARVARGAALLAAPCGPADPSALIGAVVASVENEHREEGLTLVAAGVPVFASRDADVRMLVTAWDPDAPQAPLSESAIAYPGGTSCPSTPPLVRYSIARGREGRARSVCDDYRRAFAQVGVAVNRDTGVAGSFRDIARDFVRVAGTGNVATASGFRAAGASGMFTSDAATLAPYMSVPLDPWIVSAHASQTGTLAAESDALVEELTVALDEIDHAARTRGCWQ